MRAAVYEHCGLQTEAEQPCIGVARNAMPRWRDELGSLPSSCPSPRKLALASLHLNVSASASGCGWRRDSCTTVAISSLSHGERDRGSDARSLPRLRIWRRSLFAGPALRKGSQHTKRATVFNGRNKARRKRPSLLILTW